MIYENCCCYKGYEGFKKGVEDDKKTTTVVIIGCKYLAAISASATEVFLRGQYVIHSIYLEAQRQVLNLLSLLVGMMIMKTGKFLMMDTTSLQKESETHTILSQRASSSVNFHPEFCLPANG